MLRQFNIEELRTIDPALAEEIQNRYAEILADLHSRPGIGKPRTLTITAAFMPVVDKNATVRKLLEVKTQFNVKVSKPNLTTNVHTLRANPRDESELIFQDLDRDNPDQMSIDDVRDDAGHVIPMKSGTHDES